MDFYSHFTVKSAHNAATTFEHTKKLIHWIYNNKTFTKDVIIYDTAYGCSKQYICPNAMWILSLLAFTHILIVNRCIYDPGHVGIKIYGING